MELYVQLFEILCNAILLYKLLLVEERLEALVGHVDIELGDNLKRCVHGEHRHTDVEHVDIEVRDELCDRAAAALIDLAELADLPKHACIVKRAADFGDELCVRVPPLPCAPVYLAMPRPPLM